MTYTVYLDDAIAHYSRSVDPNFKVLAPSLNVENGKAGSLSFTLLPTHPLYANVRPMKTIVHVMEDEKQIFRGRVIKYDVDNFKQKKVSCEGDLAYLLDSIQPKFDDTDKTIRSFFTECINKHNEQMTGDSAYKRFTVGTVSVGGDDTTRKFGLSSYTDTANAIDSEIVKYYGGYLRTRRVGSTTYIDLVKEYQSAPGANDQKIEFGINLQDYSMSMEGKDLFTILLPLGDDNKTIADASNAPASGFSREGIYLVNNAAVATYGRIIKAESFSGVGDANELLGKAQTFMTNNYKAIPQTYTIKALDQRLIDNNIKSFSIGDKIWLVSQPHGINAPKTCSQIDYDLINPQNTTYTFGDVKQTYTERQAKTNSDASNTAANNAESARKGTAAAAADSHRYLTETDNALRIVVSAITGTSLADYNQSGLLNVFLKDKQDVVYNSKGQVVEVKEGNGFFSNIKTAAQFAGQITVDAQGNVILKEGTGIFSTKKDGTTIRYVQHVDGETDVTNQIKVDGNGVKLEGGTITLDADNIATMIAPKIVIGGPDSDVIINGGKLTLNSKITDVLGAMQFQKPGDTDGSGTVITNKGINIDGGIVAQGLIHSKSGISGSSLTVAGDTYSKTSVPVVTDFTQASPTNMNMLASSTSTTTYSPAMGQTVHIYP